MYQILLKSNTALTVSLTVNTGGYTGPSSYIKIFHQRFPMSRRLNTSATIFISSYYLRYNCNTPFAENRHVYVWLPAKPGWQKDQCIFQTHNFYSCIYNCKVLAVPEMNSNAIQTRIRFLNPRGVLDVHAKWGICYPFQELHVHRYPEEQKGEYQERFQNWHVEQTFTLLLPHILQIS